VRAMRLPTFEYPVESGGPNTLIGTPPRDRHAGAHGSAALAARGAYRLGTEEGGPSFPGRDHEEGNLACRPSVGVPPVSRAAPARLRAKRMTADSITNPKLSSAW
jgi:hypothetical protein